MKIISYKDNHKIRKEVSHLLVTSFPLSERPPVKYFFKGVENKPNNIYAYYDNDEFIGFTYIITYLDLCYVFFLAVSSNKRNMGYGTKILSDIKKRFKDRVIFLLYEEINDKYKDNSMRIRRKEFYKRNGFKDNKLIVNEFGVTYESGYIGKHKVDYDTYLNLYINSFGEFVKDYIKKVS